MTTTDADRSLTEWVVLALLAEAPAHGFAIARQLEPGTDLGRILTVRRPLVYRALDRLVGAELIEPRQTEPGDAGPDRTVLRVTPRGRRSLRRWLTRPVDHVRDLRVEFLVKLRVNERSGRDPANLVEAQRAALASTFAHLAAVEPATDVVDLWRRNNARAARDFLDELTVA